jgi:hypothetical protein
MMSDQLILISDQRFLKQIETRNLAVKCWKHYQANACPMLVFGNEVIRAASQRASTGLMLTAYKPIIILAITLIWNLVSGL